MREAPDTIVQFAVLAIIARIDLFQKSTGVPDSTIGRLTTGDSNTIYRLRDGENITIEKLEKIERWLAAADPRRDYEIRRPRAPKKPKA